MNLICYIFPLVLFSYSLLFSQESFLPKNFDSKEIGKMEEYLSNLSIGSDVIITPPNFAVRTMAEWEEIQYLTIAWEGFEPILTEIVRNSVDQCKVIIACDNPNQVESYLEDNDVDVSNVEYLDVSTNSIWLMGKIQYTKMMLIHYF